MTVSSSHVAHFVLEGACIVEVARDAVLADRPERAIRILVESFPDMPAKTVQQILDGEKTLRGDSDSGIYLTDENPLEQRVFFTARREIYAGRVKVHKTWFRPRAVVIDRGEPDALWALGAMGLTTVPSPTIDCRTDVRYSRLENDLLLSGKMAVDEDLGKAILREFTLLRHQHYAQEGERAFYVIGSKTEIVIFEPCEPVPSWWPVRTDLAEALADFREVGLRLESRGRTARYGWKKTVSCENTLFDAELNLAEEETRLEALYAAEDRRCAESIATYREEILRRAAGDLFEFSWGVGTERKTISIPRAPFEVYATRRTGLCALAPKWDPVCPSGLKMQHDDPYHTDWMVGAGIEELSICYNDDAFRDALFEAVANVQERLGNFECAVLCDAGSVAGPVTLPGESSMGGVLVLPSLAPRYLDDMLRAGAVVTANGGAAAHLASVARDRGVTIVRVREAHNIYKPGMYLRIEPANGTITVKT